MTIHASADGVWKTALARLSVSISKDDMDTWLKPLQPASHGDGLVLYAPNAFVLEAVQEQFREAIQSNLPAGFKFRMAIGSRPKGDTTDTSAAVQGAHPSPTEGESREQESAEASKTVA